MNTLNSINWLKTSLNLWLNIVYNLPFQYMFYKLQAPPERLIIQAG